MPTKPKKPDPPKNSCGDAPGGNAQKIYFPEPGTWHHYPTTSVKLRACATSGLPITYQVIEAEDACSVSGNTVTASYSIMSQPCLIQARQDGNGEYPAAEPVSRPFQTLGQTIDMSWEGTGTIDGERRLTVKLRVSSPDGPMSNATFYVNTSGEGCTNDAEQLQHSGGSATLTFTVSPTEAGGACHLIPHVGTDAVIKGKPGDRMTRQIPPAPPKD